jgi:hypothetical protein
VTPPAGAVLRVRVVPRASRTALGRDAAGGLRAHLTAPPVEGEANRALVALLADRLGVPKAAVTIAHGARGRQKTVRIADCTQEELERRLVAALASDVDKAGPRG